MADNYTPYSGAYSGTEIDSILTKASTSETYTSAEKTKLSNLFNYDDTLVKSDISDLKSGKVDKISGKSLSTNDYTTSEKSKLSGIESGANKTTVDTVLSSSSSNPVTNSAITTAFNSKVDKVSGKGLSTNDYTSAEKTKLASLENYDDSDIRSLINGKVDKINGMGLSSNDFTDTLLSNLESIIAAFPFTMRRGAATLNADSDIGFDDIRETIYYRYTASAKGNPRTNGYGIIIAFAFTSYILQVLVSQVTSDTAILYRFSGDTGNTWRSWYQISATQPT